MKNIKPACAQYSEESKFCTTESTEMEYILVQIKGRFAQFTDYWGSLVNIFDLPDKYSSFINTADIGALSQLYKININLKSHED